MVSGKVQIVFTCIVGKIQIVRGTGPFCSDSINLFHERQNTYKEIAKVQSVA